MSEAPVTPAADLSSTPPPTETVDAAASSVTDTLSDPSLISTVLHRGDLEALGLTGWSPASLCRELIEIINVYTGLPWFWTIAGATVVLRVLLFPLALKSFQSSVRLAPYAEKIKDMQEEMKSATDPVARQKSLIKSQMLYKEAGVNPATMMASGFIQLPITIGMFFAVKSLCDLPLQQLKYGGLSWVPDLTVADPTYMLPLAATALINIQLSLASRDMVSAYAGLITNGLRVLSTLGFFIVSSLPAGVCVYLVSSSVCMMLQTLSFRFPPIRKALGIPPHNPQTAPKPQSMRESVDALKLWWAEQKNTAVEKERQARTETAARRARKL